MKKILVPTDFSDCAEHAMYAGIDFASQFNSHLVFMHNLAKGHSEKSFEVAESFVLESIDRWRKIAYAKSLSIDFQVTEGNFVNEMQELVDNINPDFVIMGSHGASGKKEFFIGSQTQKAIRSIQRPFLILKNTLNDISFNRVVYASDFQISGIDSFKYFLGLMSNFNPEIHLVAINTFSWFSQPYIVLKEAMEDYMKLAKGYVCKGHFYSDLNVEAGIRHFSESLNADLIAISNVERSPIKRTLVGSTVEALVNHSNLPVLSIDFPH